MNAAKSKKFSKTRSQNKSAVKNKIKKTVAKTDHGLIMVFTGNGKGKTTAAFGQALRAIGQGYNVFIVQFERQKIRRIYRRAKISAWFDHPSRRT